MDDDILNAAFPEAVNLTEEEKENHEDFQKAVNTYKETTAILQELGFTQKPHVPVWEYCLSDELKAVFEVEVTTFTPELPRLYFMFEENDLKGVYHPEEGKEATFECIEDAMEFLMEAAIGDSLFNYFYPKEVVYYTKKTIGEYNFLLVVVTMFKRDIPLTTEDEDTEEKAPDGNRYN